MHRVEIHTGRLVEITLQGEISVAEVHQFRGLMATRVMSIPGKVVICGDLRALEPVGAEARAMLIGIMRADNPRLVRSGHVVTPGSAAAKQVIDAVAQARSDDRRYFTEAQGLANYLAEVLEPMEKVRMFAFLEVAGNTP